jgi:hypothetical protein
MIQKRRHFSVPTTHDLHSTSYSPIPSLLFYTLGRIRDDKVGDTKRKAYG